MTTTITRDMEEACKGFNPYAKGCYVHASGEIGVQTMGLYIWLKKHSTFGWMECDASHDDKGATFLAFEVKGKKVSKRTSERTVH